jgi:type III pantothenate kinase
VTPDVVADIGNSRMKWGRVADGHVVGAEAVPLNLPSVWHNRWENWPDRATRWAVAGSNPERRDAFARWLRDRGCAVAVLADWKAIGLPVKLAAPDRVGHDRLLNALAARREAAPAVVVDAGTAVTVDLVDAAGAFAGGTIFPGVGMMARSLHQFTASLPKIEVAEATPPIPGTATEPAMAAGIWWAIVGGVRAILAEYGRGPKSPRKILLTGGDAELLLPGLTDLVELRLYLTLDGIRIAAEALP